MSVSVNEARAILSRFEETHARRKIASNPGYYDDRLLDAFIAQHEALHIAKPLDDWAEEDGPVLWWKFPICEPPYSGTPLDDDFPDYVTHWSVTPIPEVK